MLVEVIYIHPGWRESRGKEADSWYRKIPKVLSLEWYRDALFFTAQYFRC